MTANRERRTSNEERFLGIDFGTSGCRAVLIDAAGTETAKAGVTLPSPRGEDGEAEQDPESWWLALAEVMAALDPEARQRVSRLVVDGTSATLLVSDGSGRPLGPALMYNDRRAVEEAARVGRCAPPASGAHGPAAALAKLLYLAPRHPGAAHALSQADWITGRLTGRYGVTDENNALKLGHDPVARAWPAWLDHLGLDRRLLPAVVPPGTPLATLDPAAARQLGLPAGAVAVAGTTDGTAAFIAAGAAPGEAVTSLGSTLVLKVLSSRPVFEPRHGVYSHRLGERWLVGGASNSGGAALLRHFDGDRLAALTPRLRPDHPTGLDYYPLPRPGERFPVADPHLVPRESPRPADDATFLQGLLEGLARIEAEGYRLLERLGAPWPRRVITTGGGAVNTAWQAIRERALGVPVTVAGHGDAAYGAALLALHGGAGKSH